MGYGVMRWADGTWQRPEAAAKKPSFFEAGGFGVPGATIGMTGPKKQSQSGTGGFGVPGGGFGSFDASGNFDSNSGRRLSGGGSVNAVRKQDLRAEENR